MEQTYSKKLFYIMSYVTIIVAGYIVGLLSLPSPKYIEAIKKSTVSIESATLQDDSQINDTDSNSIMGSNGERLPMMRELNPFSGGKVIDLPRSRAAYEKQKIKEHQESKKDPRITQVNSQNTSATSYQMDITEVEIDIPGETNFGQQIGSENLISQLSTMGKKDKKAAKKPKKINYSPRMVKHSLVKAPIKGYVEKSSFGTLPITPAGQKPLWQAYRNPTHIAMGQKPMSIILGGLGTNYNLSVEAIKTLPANVTLGFIPYVNNLQKLIDLAREYGHEVILEIPMESHDFPRIDAGPLALKVSDTPEQYAQKIKTLLGRATGYSGIMNYLGSKYLANDKAMITLLTDLKKRGLYFLENKTLRAGIMQEYAENAKIPYGASFSIIDEDLTPSMLKINMQTLEQNTLQGTPIIRTAYLSRLTLNFLKNHLRSYKTDHQFQLIPVSAYVDKK